MLESLRRWSGGEIPSGEYPSRVTVDAMDRAGVDFGLLSAWHGPQGVLIGNDEVAAWVAERPHRLAGLAAVDLNRPMTAVRELRRCVGEPRLQGPARRSLAVGSAANRPALLPAVSTCIELGVPFCTQVGHTGPLRPSETGRPIPYIDQIALDFPELVIVAGHIGYPWTEEMIAVTRKHENVYIDTSAYTVRRYPPELVSYMGGGGGRGKVLFGSNYPMILAEKALEDLDALELDDEARELFLAGNAARVFKLGGLGASRSVEG